MIWVNRETGEIYEMRLTSVGEDNYDHGKFKTFEIAGVVLMGEVDCTDLSLLEFVGWL